MSDPDSRLGGAPPQAEDALLLDVIAVEQALDRWAVDTSARAWLTDARAALAALHADAVRVAALVEVAEAARAYLRDIEELEMSDTGRLEESVARLDGLETGGDARFECGCWFSEVGAHRFPAITGRMCCPIHHKPYGPNAERRPWKG